MTQSKTGDMKIGPGARHEASSGLLLNHCDTIACRNIV
jgi:hypothetical protein